MKSIDRLNSFFVLLGMGFHLVSPASATPLTAPAAKKLGTIKKPLSPAAAIKALDRYKTPAYSLRLLKSTDFNRMKEILQHPEAIQISGDHVDDETIRFVITESIRATQQSTHEWHVFSLGINERRTGELIGLIQLYDHKLNNASATLGFNLLRSRWGQNIMPRAARLFLDFTFQELNLARIDASTLKTNERANAVLKGLGFKLTGTRFYRNNPQMIDNVYSLDRELRKHSVTFRSSPN